MVEKKGRSGSGKPTATKEVSAPSSMSMGGGVSMSLPATTGGSMMPPSMLTKILDADITEQLMLGAPVFGDVLEAIGQGVADSQAELDHGLVDTATRLSNETIEYISDVVTVLNEDGLPIPEQTELVKNEVSLINFINPQAHEWRHVALSMDLNVGALDVERGFTFTRSQSRDGYSTAGLFWGFVGWTTVSSSNRVDSYSRDTARELEWAQGSVRVDAMITPRRTGKFPIPAKMETGPQIFFSQGPVSTVDNGDGTVTRSTVVTIRCRKADGSPNPGKVLTTQSQRFTVSNVTGNTTDADGIIQVEVSRTKAAAAPAIQGILNCALNNVKRDTTISL